MTFGVWATPQAELFVRGANTIIREQDNLGRETFAALWAFAGVRYWPNENVFIAGGVGLAWLATLQGSCSNCTRSGTALDLRIVFPIARRCDHMLDLSIEVTPSFFHEGRASGLGLLLGYQYLGATSDSSRKSP